MDVGGHEVIGFGQIVLDTKFRQFLHPFALLKIFALVPLFFGFAARGKDVAQCEKPLKPCRK